MSKSGGNLTTQYNLRWSDELKEKIAQSAKEHNRSMNADIVARLEQSFFQEFSDRPDISAELDEIQKRIDKQDLVLEKLLKIGEKYQNSEK